ncbi:YqjK-like family protein [Biostraticola tofi]|uniref:YqjK-like protein n=1 Tax=Biostraticola tofi TaxID=466109 RepID=A0A4R3Z1D2_9GAMM|nr:YqjK-like family protein [Biostraticola tofi]TCV98801.1 YqjK-like protein [Biostraticola tofi]
MSLSPKKQLLLRKVHQQRIELSAGKREWSLATERYDRAWQSIMHYRKYLIAGSSLLAVYNLRHPSKLVLWARRVVGIMGTVKLIRKSLQSR